MSHSYLSIEDVEVSFQTKGGTFTAIRNIDLKVDNGQFVSLIGHSGCGKSTLLNVVAGLVRAK
jgi:nitrate/nitrite transport system ATP-binding protein